RRCWPPTASSGRPPTPPRRSGPPTPPRRSGPPTASRSPHIPNTGRARPRPGSLAGRPLCLRLADVDEPGDAELVDDHAELVAPGLLLHRHRGVPAGGQLLPVAAQDVPIVAAQADSEARRGMIFPHVAGVVGSHDCVTGVGLKLAVHDLVSVRRVF